MKAKYTHNYRRCSAVIISVMLIFVGLSSCSAAAKKYYKSGLSMGTDTAITLFSNKKKETVQSDLEAAFDLSITLEDRVSCHKPNSVISRLNEAGILDVTDDFVLNLIRRSVEYSKMTSGTFDPSIYHILKLWDWTGTPHLPSAEAINDAMTKCGYNKIDIHGTIVSLNGTQLDLGGIAKGAIVQAIADFLHDKGYRDFIVNGGGDIYASGKFEGRRPWRIAVADPFNSSSFIDTIVLSDSAIVTSGDYQRFFEENGVVYHHILNPADGYPAKNGTHSVTIIAEDAGFADALATAVFVMGAERGAAFCRQNGIRAIIVSGEKGSMCIERIENF